MLFYLPGVKNPQTGAKHGGEFGQSSQTGGASFSSLAKYIAILFQQTVKDIGEQLRGIEEDMGE